MAQTTYTPLFQPYPSNINPTARPPPPQQEGPPEIPHLQSTEEDALVICHLHGHVPTDGIAWIVDGLRAGREAKPQLERCGCLHRTRGGQVRIISMDREARQSEEQECRSGFTD
jgi:hypothetical protein